MGGGRLEGLTSTFTVAPAVCKSIHSVLSPFEDDSKYNYQMKTFLILGHTIKTQGMS